MGFSDVRGLHKIAVCTFVLGLFLVLVSVVVLALDSSIRNRLAGTILMACGLTACFVAGLVFIRANQIPKERMSLHEDDISQQDQTPQAQNSKSFRELRGTPFHARGLSSYRARVSSAPI